MTPTASILVVTVIRQWIANFHGKSSTNRPNCRSLTIVLYSYARIKIARGATLGRRLLTARTIRMIVKN